MRVRTSRDQKRLLRTDDGFRNDLLGFDAEWFSRRVSEGESVGEAAGGDVGGVFVAGRDELVEQVHGVLCEGQVAGPCQR